MMFAVFLIIAGMLGAWWMFRLSNEHYAEAAFGYGLLGAIWAVACLAVAVKFFPT